MDTADDSSEITYIPEGIVPDLEVDDDVYRFLEYFSLDWPAQSIDFINPTQLVVGTNPPEEHKQSISIISFSNPLESLFDAMGEFTVQKLSTKHSVNRIRWNDSLYLLGDELLSIYNNKNELIKEIKGEFGYGIGFSKEEYFIGSKSGEIITPFEKHQVHTKSIECIDVFNNTMFTGSCDYKAISTDIRSWEQIFELPFSCDINCLGFNGDNTLGLGCDDGVIRLVDIRNTKNCEDIKWHSTPISCFMWGSRDVFATGSDEQVCLWDTSFIEDWNFHRYLSFIHQGHTFYKSVMFWKESPEYVITSALEGLCVFSPIETIFQ
ncbi:Ribosome assembly protein rrb1 [Astathelohania contejeani]|uniref:Ribosome assembly protein rrb1 n=1 Tax=Astathelohania contejeani TaxID=164912 RepID=A0ABQ7HZP3_9MICR|nr:Ribosome assembly protein rrb1 [Thelohania contejeani]